MQGSWISPSRHDLCMDNKIHSESVIENILPTKYLYGPNQCQIQFYLFLHFKYNYKLGYEIYLNR